MGLSYSPVNTWTKISASNAYIGSGVYDSELYSQLSIPGWKNDLT